MRTNECCTNKDSNLTMHGAHMDAARARIVTGSDALDNALGGGLPEGFTLLLEGAQGVGSTELAFTLLRAAVKRTAGRKAVFLSALRSGGRVRQEAERLFEAKFTDGFIRFTDTPPAKTHEAALALLGGLQPGDVLTVESLSALADSEHERGLLTRVQQLGDAAQKVGALLILLHSPGSLDPRAEAQVAESVDGVFSFRVRESGSSARRALVVSKMRGLAPALEGENLPVFEAALRSGIGFAIVSVKSVV